MKWYNDFIKDEIVDINLLRDFRYVIKDSICSDELDMLPYGNEIYIISSLERSEKHIDFAISKNIEQSLDCISTKTNGI